MSQPSSASQQPLSQHSTPAPVRPTSSMFWYFAIGAGGVVLLLMMIGVGTQFLSEHAPGLAWMTIAGGGFIAIVVVMILAAIVYKVMGTEDPRQALGMPQGSVRSLLMFLVFSLLGVFVFFSVDVISKQEHERSVIIVFEGEDINSRIQALGDGLQVVSIRPGPMVERGSGDAIREVTTTEIEVELTRGPSAAAIDHINQIAIAVFSMASSIIGYYFGTRSQIPPFGRDSQSGDTDRSPDPSPQNDPLNSPDASGTEQAASLQTPPAPDFDEQTDAPDWGLANSQIAMAMSDGAYRGNVEFASEEISEDVAFGGMIVPPEDARDRFKDFSVDVKRAGPRLQVAINGPDSPSLTGALLSLYPIDNEDAAQSIEIQQA